MADESEIRRDPAAERNVHKMKLGMSCYCLDGAMAKGMTVDEVIDFAAAHGCEHIEFVPPSTWSLSAPTSA